MAGIELVQENDSRKSNIFKTKSCLIFRRGTTRLWIFFDASKEHPPVFKISVFHERGTPAGLYP
jgi:hypothetical protein